MPTLQNICVSKIGVVSRLAQGSGEFAAEPSARCYRMELPHSLFLYSLGEKAEKETITLADLTEWLPFSHHRSVSIDTNSLKVHDITGSTKDESYTFETYSQTVEKINVMPIIFEHLGSFKTSQ